MRYREIPPHASLRHFVQCFWTLDHEAGTGAPQRVTPDGHSELILNAGQPFEALEDGHWRRQPRSFLAGQIDGPLLLRPSGPARIFGIRFHPHGAATLFGPRMDELARRFTRVDDLAPALSRDLHAAIQTGDPLLRIETALLRAQARVHTRVPLIEESVRRIAHSPAVGVTALARALDLSLRQFERRFTANVGLPPKLFCRIQRFLQVFPVIHQQPNRWADTAADCGYYDQGHLIRDCKRFTGETPAVLLSHDADLARHFLQRYGVSHSYNTAARHRL